MAPSRALYDRRFSSRRHRARQPARARTLLRGRSPASRLGAQTIMRTTLPAPPPLPPGKLAYCRSSGIRDLPASIIRRTSAQLAISVVLAREFRHALSPSLAASGSGTLSLRADAQRRKRRAALPVQDTESHLNPPPSAPFGATPDAVEYSRALRGRALTPQRKSRFAAAPEDRFLLSYARRERIG